MKYWMIAAMAALCACNREVVPVPVLQTFPASARPLLDAQFRKANENPKDAAATGELGMLYHAYERHGAAEQCYARARELAPSEPKWAHLYGMVLDEQGKIGDAADQYRQAGAGVGTQLKLARALLKMGKVDEAAGLFEALSKKDANLAAAHAGLGAVWEKRGKFAEALESYRKAESLAPQAGEPRLGITRVYRAQNRQEELNQALAAYESRAKEPVPDADPIAIELRKKKRDQAFYVEEGKALLAAGKAQDSIGYFERALEMDSSFGPAHANLVAAYSALGKFDSAETHYGKAVVAGVQTEDLDLHWGVALLNHGRLPDARQSFERALKKNPNSREAHANLGKVLLAQNQSGPAMEHLLQAAEVADSRQPEFLLAVANGYQKAGQRGKAIEYAQKALQSAKDHGQNELAASIEQSVAEIKTGRK